MDDGPPGPDGVPVLGNGVRYARSQLDVLTACAREYDGPVELDLAGRRAVVVTDPADVERVLVTDAGSYVKAAFRRDAVDRLLGYGMLLGEGERWRRHRALAQPAFDTGRIDGLADGVVDHAEATVADWTPGETREVSAEMARLTVTVFADLVFGVDLDDATTDAVQDASGAVMRRFRPELLHGLLPNWLPTRRNRDYRAAVDTLDGVLDDLVAARRAKDGGGGMGGDGGVEDADDLLAVLLRAHAADDRPMDDRELRDEMKTMLLAGHDTTALVLTYAWYLLSEHPAAADRVASEVESVVGDGRPTVADLPALEYTGRVLQEAMRLYPPVYAMYRRPTEDVTLGGYDVPEGSIVVVPPWAVHRHPDHWDDPDSFDPGRFADDRAADRARFAYVPFGAGPRHCVGRHLAERESKLVVATIARDYRLEYVGESSLSLFGSITLQPDEPVEMVVRER